MRTPEKIVGVRVGVIPADQAAYWDEIDDRVTCDGCRRRVGQACSATRQARWPLGFKHRCSSFARRARAKATTP